MTEDPELRAKLAKEGRLWLLSLACAAPGAAAIWLTGSLAIGVAVFLGCLLIFGGLLLVYEKRRR